MTKPSDFPLPPQSQGNNRAPNPTAGFFIEPTPVVRGRIAIIQDCIICGHEEKVDAEPYTDYTCVICGTLYSFDEGMMYQLSPKQVECLKRHMDEWKEES